MPLPIPSQAVVRLLLARALAIALFLAAAAPAAAVPAAGEPVQMTLEVDARDVLRGIQHARIVMPVRPGPLRLAYPKWVPGEHRPNGPITQLVNLRIMAADRALAWRRDPREPFAFHVDVPQGATEVEIRFDYLSPAKRFGAGFGKTPNVTPSLAFVLFNHLLLYPAGARADEVRVEARLRIPDGWEADGALPLARTGDGALELPETSLSTLVDSPVLAGALLRKIPLPNHSFAARLTLAAESPDDLEPGREAPQALGRLVDEARRLVGGVTAEDYVWLVAMSDSLSHDGLEHRQSADIRAAPGFLRDPRQRYRWTVLPHELFHAWNGKFRRPSGMTTANFQEATSDELLWVYEGLTRYYGDIVLPTRSGLVSRAQTIDYLAYVGAQVERGRPGRAWRSLADTAAAVPAFADAPFEGTATRRGADYYNEMLLVWLEADMLIRTRSRGRRSLDDFCRRFLARQAGDPAVAPYTRADVVRALRSVEALDWDAFFRARVDAVAPPVPLAGLAAAGWTLDYDDSANPFLDDVENGSGNYDLSTSLGIWISADGEVRDVVPGSPAFEAAIAPGARILEIDGQRWSIDAARERILAGRTGTRPLRLRVRSGPLERVVDILYRGGLQIPHLRRAPGTEDGLSRILAPLAATPH
ncbi:M61 family peptidase [Sphingosinicella sp. CPCC 101087]|uniref:M61 family metallopeptidase n=1 Tax=Sphingosinicella sp. CPCC 101087 TaxID=2497754 RepID=UPI00101CAA75|nr:M61 family peptidase [Sphingosinicella sp. CPCC 101087]